MSFWAFLAFLPPITPTLPPPNHPENLIWKHVKKNLPEDIIILHKCTKNHDHLLYCSWNMTCDRCNFYFSFWGIFCPFTPLTALNIKILNIKKCQYPKYQKLWSDDVQFLRYAVHHTDGWKMWHIEAPTSIYYFFCPSQNRTFNHSTLKHRIL